MIQYHVQGGSRLSGSVPISGAKNAAVAIIPAALMVDGVCRIENIPQISDVTLILQILRELGVKSLRLLTNNPDKVYQLSEFGLEIAQRVPIQMRPTAYDLHYLKTKQARMGHLLQY